jgi:hypothetical protein
MRDPNSPPLMEIAWKSIIVYASYQNAQGVRELRRYAVALPSTTAPTNVTVTFQAATITIDVGGTSPLVVTRSGGIMLLEELTEFDIVSASAGGLGPSATATAAGTFTVTLARRVKTGPGKFTPVRRTTTALGRNS